MTSPNGLLIDARSAVSPSPADPAAPVPAMVVIPPGPDGDVCWTNGAGTSSATLECRNNRRFIAGGDSTPGEIRARYARHAPLIAGTPRRRNTETGSIERLSSGDPTRPYHEGDVQPRTRCHSSVTDS